MFEWTPGIPIMDEMTQSEDKYLDKKNTEVELIEDIVKTATQK